MITKQQLDSWAPEAKKANREIKQSGASKSIRRHELKEVDKKWKGRKVSAPEHALNKFRK
jgi:hypothetical protein